MARSVSPDLAAILKWQNTTWVEPSVYDDPFYSVETNTANVSAGTLFKLQLADPSQRTIPPSIALWRFSYQSKTLLGDLVPVSGYILFPYNPRKEIDGTAKVVAWAHGTTGVTPECAPTHRRDLWLSYYVPFPLALQGYVVVATDYAGLGISTDANGKQIFHEYHASHAGANDVLYSLQAARTAFPQLSQRFTVIGHSQGGGVALAVAEKMTEDPIDGYLGVVSLSPMTSLFSQQGRNTNFDTIAAATLQGMRSVYPKFDFYQLLKADAQDTVKTLLSTEAPALGWIVSIEGTDPFVDGWEQDEHVQKYANLIAVGGRTVLGPVFVAQGLADTNLSPEVAEEVIERTAVVNPDEHFEFVSMGNITHDPAAFASQQLWLDWIDELFQSTEQLQSGLSKTTITPFRPAAEYQPEVNNYLGFPTEYWMVP